MSEKVLEDNHQIKNEKTAVVLPAYDPNIEELKEYIIEIQSKIEPTEIRIEVDQPRSNVLDLLEARDVSVSISSQRRGKGGAIIDGFDEVSGDYYVFVDSDRSIKVDSIKSIIRPILRQNVDLVVGSRYHPNGSVHCDRNRFRRLLGETYAWMARRLLPESLFDYQCGAKAIRADTWHQIRPMIRQTGFAWDTEVIALCSSLDFTISEVPIAWQNNPNSTLDIHSDSINMFNNLLITAYKCRKIQYRNATYSAKSRGV